MTSSKHILCANTTDHSSRFVSSACTHGSLVHQCLRIQALTQAFKDVEDDLEARSVEVWYDRTYRQKNDDLKKYIHSHV